MFSAVTVKAEGELFETTTPLLRLVLYKGEVFHLPRVCQEVHILSGSAWITLAGRDIMAAAGERVTVPAGADLALISGLREQPLVFEVGVRSGCYPAELRLTPSTLQHHSIGRWGDWKIGRLAG